MANIDKNNLDSKKIFDVLEDIVSNSILLPSMQRKCVWSEEKIINLFDSIMRGYPFGNFLFWHIEDKNELKKYHFYNFKDTVDEIKNNWDCIKTALFNVKNFLSRMHMCEESIISYNALLPISKAKEDYLNLGFFYFSKMYLQLTTTQ